MVRVLLLAVALCAAPLTAAADAAASQPADPTTAAPAQPAQPTQPAAAPASAPPAAAPPASAAPSARPDPLDANPPDMPGEGTGYLLFKTLVVLGIVVAVIYLTLNVGVRKLFKLGPQRGGLVQIVDRVPLDPKKSLYVLKVGAEYLLVGAAESNLSFLTKLDAEGVQTALAERVQAKPTTSFLERLNTLAKPPRKNP